MGRTQRRRRRKNFNYQNCQPLDHEESIINLRKFMTRNGFNDGINLTLRNFPETGRGVATMKTLQENDILIRVPFGLMISYATLKTTNFLDFFTPKSKLTIHDLLSTFLVFEKHKNHSIWKDYLYSLPSEPPWLPCFLSEEQTELLPVDLRLGVKKTRRLFEESWSRIKRSIRNDRICDCCAKKVSCVIDLPSFTWGYILVNTRAVYVDPQLVREICNCCSDGVLSDEPCMALCPFLDMFNHSYEAKSKAKLTYKGKQAVFELMTLTKYKKYKQVFISYGDFANDRLLTEYGFFIPGNWHDCIPIQKEEVWDLLKLSLNNFQYKFIQRHGLDVSLYVNKEGASFNLKGLLFIVLRAQNMKNIASIVYSNCYSEDFLESVNEICCKLLHRQMENLNKNLTSKLHPLVFDFLRYRCNLIKQICK